MRYTSSFLALTLLLLASLPLWAQEQQAKSYFQSAEKKRKARQYAEAIIDYETAISYAPTIPDYYIQKGRCHFILKEYSAAIETFEQVLTVDPKTFEAYNSLWKLYGLEKQPDKMIQTYERAAKAATSDKLKLLYVINIIDFLDKTDRESEVMPYLEQVKEINATAPETQFVWGKYHLKRDEKEQAITYLESAMKQMEDKPLKESGQYLYLLGKAYYESARYGAALELLKKITAGPYQPLAFRMLPDYHYFVGAAYHDLFQPQAAKDALMQALNIDPNHEAAGRLLVRERVILERADELAETMSKKLSTETDGEKRLQLRGQLSELYLQGGEYAKAVRTAKDYLSSKPDDSDVKLIGWMAEFMESQEPTALAMLENEAESLSGATQMRYKTALGILYRRTGQEEKAIEAFKEVSADKNSDFRHLADYELSQLIQEE